MKLAIADPPYPPRLCTKKYLRPRASRWYGDTFVSGGRMPEMTPSEIARAEELGPPDFLLADEFDEPTWFVCPACGASFKVRSPYSERIYCSHKCRRLSREQAQEQR